MSAGLSSSPPGPHSPHSLSPDTPPPAYSPRLLAFTRVRKGSMNYCGRDIDTDRPPPESNNGMETDNNSAEAVPYQVSIFTFPFYAPFSFPQLTFLFHFAFANIVSNFYTRNPSTGRPSPIMSWTAELGRFTTPTTTRSSSTGSRTQATRTTTGSAWVSCQMWTATRLSRTRGATLERVFTCIMWEARSMQSASVILLYSCRYSIYINFTFKVQMNAVVTCLSFQSRNCNYHHGFHPTTVWIIIIKLLPADQKWVFQVIFHLCRCVRFLPAAASRFSITKSLPLFLLRSVRISENHRFYSLSVELIETIAVCQPWIRGSVWVDQNVYDQVLPQFLPAYMWHWFSAGWAL